MKTIKVLVRAVFVAAVAIIASCGGGGGSSPPLHGVATIAGPTGGAGYIDATGSAARFNFPDDVATDGTNLYVADSANNTIRQIEISTGAVTTLAGTAGSSGHTDGTGAAALFNAPCGIATDGTNLYVADTNNNTIRQIVISSKEVTTLAGDALFPPNSTDGTGAAARFNAPWGIATDGTNLYVADKNNHTIRQIEISSKAVSTLAGTALSPGFAEGTGAAARFRFPSDIATDGTNLYVADTSNHTIRQVVISSQVVTTLAGTGAFGSTDGAGTVAKFYFPYGIAIGGTNLYVADTSNHTIRQIVISSKVVSTLAGDASFPPDFTDGTGADARFRDHHGIATDGTNLYVADTWNHTIRQVVISSKEVTTLAGTAGTFGSANGTGSDARFRDPFGITTDGTNLYVADRSNNTIRQIVISTGAVTTLAGYAGLQGITDATGAAARFKLPAGITTDGTNLYVADTLNHTIRQIEISTGDVTTLAGTAGVSGSTDANGTNALFNSPCGITTDGTNLFVADTNNHTIRQIVISSKVVSTLAGTALSPGSTDGTEADARFRLPHGITTDGTNLYVADRMNHTIRQIKISTGAVTTLTGSATKSGTVDGSWSDAVFFRPYAIVSGGTGLPLYVATENHNVRKIY